ncbi:hypothetical protein [Paenibacillus sp. YYML68]|uniref:hypothetical protein n=1 Tax=Paenibacillus sp. YYML68 TaxID=2909250 RepID=UPI0024926117|nr:hypothetical protein [Paenibacillus sp. YYML68]
MHRRLHNERGMTNMLVTLMVMPIMLFLAFAIVPFFVYVMKANHIYTAASHAMKEAEAVGYVSPQVQQRLSQRLQQLGLPPTAVNGVSFPSYAGSTTTRVLRSSADPAVKLELTYPAPGLARMLGLIRGGGGAASDAGYYRVVLYGKSEAY